MPRPVTFLRSTVWIPLLLAAVAVSIQAFRITGKPADYYAIAKIVVVVQDKRPNSDIDLWPSMTPELAALIGMEIEFLESVELKHRAADRVRSVHPELKETGVEIRVTETKDGFVLNVNATGGEPKYTRFYLEALLDEYWSSPKKLNTADYYTSIMQRPDPAVEIIPDLWRPLLFAALAGGSLGVILMVVIASAATLLSNKQNKVLRNPQ